MNVSALNWIWGSQECFKRIIVFIFAMILQMRCHSIGLYLKIATFAYSLPPLFYRVLYWWSKTWQLRQRTWYCSNNMCCKSTLHISSLESDCYSAVTVFQNHFKIRRHGALLFGNTILRWESDLRTKGSILKNKHPGRSISVRTEEIIARVRPCVLLSTKRYKVHSKVQIFLSFGCI